MAVTQYFISSSGLEENRPCINFKSILPSLEADVLLNSLQSRCILCSQMYKISLGIFFIHMRKCVKSNFEKCLLKKFNSLK